ncbi:hydroxyacid dehydrogenase [Uliginosibacterium sp. sgz301328]|uniref:hydroxyacid dehydrogenase n=1 Tax=Uliginosibacterium sp. sgz301328 TaxID=3243764 RepID=UPI00359CE841
MKVLVAIHDRALRDNIFDAATIERLTSRHDVTWLDEAPSRDGFAAALTGCEACITSWGSPRFDAQLLRDTPSLRFIGHAAGTLAPYLDASAFDGRLTIVNSGWHLAMSTAECALTLMLAGAWRLHAYGLRMRAGNWSDSHSETVPGVHGNTVGLVGMGDISRRVIEYLRPLQARVLLHSRHCTPEQAQKLGVEVVPLDALFAQSDIVSLHATLTPQNVGMVGQAQLELMRDGSLLVNTARARLIDDAALRAALRSGRIHAALDVFDKEPLPADDELLALPNVTCAPHIGGFAEHWRKKVGSSVVDALEDVIAGRTPAHLVTRERFAAMSAN